MYLLIFVLFFSLSCDDSGEIDYVIHNNLNEEILVKINIQNEENGFHRIPSKCQLFIYKERGFLCAVDEMVEMDILNNPDTIVFFKELSIFKISNNTTISSPKDFILRQFWTFETEDMWNGEYKLIIDENSF